MKQETLSNGTLLCHGSRKSGHSIKEYGESGIRKIFADCRMAEPTLLDKIFCTTYID